MRKRERTRSSGLFLLELLLATLFFCLSAAICVRIFFAARTMSREAVRLNLAVTECSSAAELIKASTSLSDAEEKLTRFFAGAEKREGKITAAIPKNEKNGSGNDNYLLIIEVTEDVERSLLFAEIVFMEDVVECYRLSFCHFTGGA